MNWVGFGFTFLDGQLPIVAINLWGAMVLARPVNQLLGTSKEVMRVIP